MFEVIMKRLLVIGFALISFTAWTQHHVGRQVRQLKPSLLSKLYDEFYELEARLYPEWPIYGLGYHCAKNKNEESCAQLVAMIRQLTEQEASSTYQSLDCSTLLYMAKNQALMFISAERAPYISRWYLRQMTRSHPLCLSVRKRVHGTYIDSWESLTEACITGAQNGLTGSCKELVKAFDEKLADMHAKPSRLLSLALKMQEEVQRINARET